VRHIAKECQVLNGDRLVEAEFVFQHEAVLFGGMHWQHRRDWVTGEQDEDKGNHTQQQQDDG
jgi:hypothetical protein